MTVTGSGRLPVGQADCHDEPCGVPPCCNGDADENGEINIGDAMYILAYHFGGGPEAAVIERLSATGQTKCYDNSFEITQVARQGVPAEAEGVRHLVEIHQLPHRGREQSRERHEAVHVVGAHEVYDVAIQVRGQKIGHNGLALGIHVGRCSGRTVRRVNCSTP
jgi:hypothetical protein